MPPPQKTALIRKEHLPCEEVMPRQAPPWQGAQCEGRGCYKEGTETDQIFIQTQGSSDQILAVKTHLLLL